MPGECFDIPGDLYEKNVCLNDVSKNARGELRLEDRMTQDCGKPECRTLKTIHGLKVELHRHDCDDDLSTS